MFKTGKNMFCFLLLLLLTNPTLADEYFAGEIPPGGSATEDPRCWISVPNLFNIEIKFPAPSGPAVGDPWNQGTVGACAFTSFVNMQKRIAGVNDLRPFAKAFRRCLIKKQIPHTLHGPPRVDLGQMQTMIDCKEIAMQEAYGITVDLSGYNTGSNFGNHGDWNGFNNTDGPCDKIVAADSAMIVTLSTKTHATYGTFTSPHASAVESAQSVGGYCEVTVTDPNNPTASPKPVLKIDNNGQVTDCTPSSSCGSYPVGTPPADSSTVNAYITETKQ